mmetsp:Transcript_24783/g.63129  ORF Transcript_24783/g.63129 Transcript_24783/m.63129 type:complete len:254 (-) Transcript_24783:68-829(-)
MATAVPAGVGDRAAAELPRRDGVEDARARPHLPKGARRQGRRRAGRAGRHVRGRRRGDGIDLRLARRAWLAASLPERTGSPRFARQGCAPRKRLCRRRRPRSFPGRAARPHLAHVTSEEVARLLAAPPLVHDAPCCCCCCCEAGLSHRRWCARVGDRWCDRVGARWVSRVRSCRSDPPIWYGSLCLCLLRPRLASLTRARQPYGGMLLLATHRPPIRDAGLLSELISNTFRVDGAGMRLHALRASQSGVGGRA